MPDDCGMLKKDERWDDKSDDKEWDDKAYCIFVPPSHEATDHQVFVWSMGVTVILLSMAAFSFLLSAINDMMQERRELAMLTQAAAAGGGGGRRVIVASKGR